ncbi:MAG: hypothetical protein MJ211_11650 [Bacteroidales bacterium]|nr:hypothetical protein [Bacteroidales bacterium]
MKFKYLSLLILASFFASCSSSQNSNTIDNSKVCKIKPLASPISNLKDDDIIDFLYPPSQRPVIEYSEEQEEGFDGPLPCDPEILFSMPFIYNNETYIYVAALNNVIMDVMATNAQEEKFILKYYDNKLEKIASLGSEPYHAQYYYNVYINMNKIGKENYAFFISHTEEGDINKSESISIDILTTNFVIKRVFDFDIEQDYFLYDNESEIYTGNYNIEESQQEMFDIITTHINQSPEWIDENAEKYKLIDKESITKTYQFSIEQNKYIEKQ